MFKNKKKYPSFFLYLCLQKLWSPIFFVFFQLFLVLLHVILWYILRKKIFYSRLKILFSMQPAFFILVIKTTPRKDKNKRILAWNQKTRKNNLFESPYSPIPPLWYRYVPFIRICYGCNTCKKKKRIYINCAHDLDFKKNSHYTQQQKNQMRSKCYLANHIIMNCNN